MRTEATDFFRMGPALRRLNKRRFVEGDQVPDELYQGYRIIFRDLGLEVVESPLLDLGQTSLIAAPVGATMTISEHEDNQTKVFLGAHGLSHLLLNHGEGKEWFLLRDNPEGNEPSQDAHYNREANALAKVILDSGNVSFALRLHYFKNVLRRIQTSLGKVRRIS